MLPNYFTSSQLQRAKNLKKFCDMLYWFPNIPGLFQNFRTSLNGRNSAKTGISVGTPSVATVKLWNLVICLVNLVSSFYMLSNDILQVSFVSRAHLSTLFGYTVSYYNIWIMSKSERVQQTMYAHTMRITRSRRSSRDWFFAAPTTYKYPHCALALSASYFFAVPPYRCPHTVYVPRSETYRFILGSIHRSIAIDAVQQRCRNFRKICSKYVFWNYVLRTLCKKGNKIELHIDQSIT